MFTSTIQSQTGPATFQLSNKQSIRLADIQATAVAPATSASLIGRRLSFAITSTQPNRYGALPAHAFFADENQSPNGTSEAPASDNWVQARLVQSGQAIFDPDPFRSKKSPPSSVNAPAKPLPPPLSEPFRDHWDCLTALSVLEPERTLPPLDASQPSALEKHIGTFVALKGQPTRISTSRNRMFLNFGKDWRTDTTIVIPSRLIAAFPDWAEQLKEIIDQDVVVRGWLERRRAPIITVNHPQALRILQPTQKAR
ncbi:MAG: hypothetical protein AAFV45_10790 [Pseudomonadota bacterium]